MELKYTRHWPMSEEKANLHARLFLQNLYDETERRNTGDAFIKVHDNEDLDGHKVFHAHSLILKNIDYFAKMFNGDFKEKQVIDGKLRYDIDLSDIQIPTFEAILEFIYTGKITKASCKNNSDNDGLSLFNWEQIYQAADYFGLEELLDEAIWQITNGLSDMEALRILLTWGNKYDEVKDYMVCQLSQNGATPFSKGNLEHLKKLSYETDLPNESVFALMELFTEFKITHTCTKKTKF
jgi:hypothetical protein